jgi:hypothetical protein
MNYISVKQWQWTDPADGTTYNGVRGQPVPEAVVANKDVLKVLLSRDNVIASQKKPAPTE